jgi:hypothetical protein
MSLELAICSLICSSIIYGSIMDPAPEFYNDIRDIRDPTLAELSVLQERLLHIQRPILKKLEGIEFISREFKLLSDIPSELPESGHHIVNTNAADHQNCIIIYSSFNQRYPQGVRRLVDAIIHSDYKGHVYYQIGSWPNIEDGDLCLAHVPFAFKPCFLKKMQKKGYQKVLWLDSSLLPVPGVSLNLIFDMIERLGMFIQAGDHTIGQFMNEEAAAAFGLTLEQAAPILSCSAAFIGVDFTKPRITTLVDAWYRAAKHPHAFFSARADQNALSILIHQLGLGADMLPRKLIGSIDYYTGSFFIMDREYVKDERIH